MGRFKIYYTADEITTNLFTFGAEWMTEDETEYIGAYHRYTTGEVYSNSTWQPKTSVKLIPYFAPDSLNKKNKTYINLQPNLNLKKNQPIKIPLSITTTDIQNKFVVRYFIKKINDSQIIEINQKQYNDWKNNNIDRILYKAVDLVWFISGNINDTINGSTKIPGVLTSNQQNIDVASKTIPELKSYLSNLLEFYTDSDYVVPADINGLDS